jgi:hypothetical protein
VYVGTPACACARHHQCGKNWNYFVSHNRTYVEVWPSPPHTVRSIALDQACTREEEEEPEQIVDTTAITPSFATVEEIQFPQLQPHQKLLTRGRGGACCIEMILNQQIVFVGIQHLKTPSQNKRLQVANVTNNHYLSRLYAFRKDPPFRLVAQSGLFCMGFPPDNKEDQQAPIRPTRWRIFRLGNAEFASCPRIHFVSGMTFKVNDPTTVLISYGINDCASRIAEVPLSELERLLTGNL